MENLKIKGSHGVFFIPTVVFDARTGVCEISGESYLEDAAEFYNPLIDWIDKYITLVNKSLTFNFKLTYFNTSSSRRILDMLGHLKDYQDNGGKVTVNWYYEEDDADMEEEVEDFIIESEIDTNLLPYPDDDDDDEDRDVDAEEDDEDDD